MIHIAGPLPEGSLKADIVELCILYGCESALGLLGGRSTLAGWRRIDFLLHHLPYTVVVGGAVICGLPIFDAFPCTLPLTLLTSANEAITIGFSLGLSRAFDRPNRLYLLVLMLVLVFVEVSEACAALVPPPGGVGRASAMQGVALLTLGAPAYHALAVVPCCWRKLRSRKALLAASFSTTDADPAKSDRKIKTT